MIIGLMISRASALEKVRAEQKPWGGQAEPGPPKGTSMNVSISCCLQRPQAEW